MALTSEQEEMLTEAISNLNKSVQINAEILEIAKDGGDTTTASLIAEHNGSDTAHNNSSTLAILARDVKPYGLGMGQGTMPQVSDTWATSDGKDDLNAINKTGIYSVRNGADGTAPAKVTSVIHVERNDALENSAWQLASTSAGLRYRHRRPEGWTEWENVHSSMSIITPSFSSSSFDPSYTARRSNIIKGEIPSSNTTIGRFSIQAGTADTARNRVATFMASLQSNGDTQAALTAYKNIADDSTTFAQIRLVYPMAEDEVPYSLLPTPKDDADSDAGATTSWVRKFISDTSTTSDETKKAHIQDIPEAAIRAWSKVNFKQFKYTEAIGEKGVDNARFHTGVIAQQVVEAFASEGLDATKYGVVCLKKWGNQYKEIIHITKPEEIVKDPVTGEETVIPEEFYIEKKLIKAAGQEWGIRYEEALVFECAYQRWRLSKIEEQLASK